MEVIFHTQHFVLCSIVVLKYFILLFTLMNRIIGTTELGLSLIVRFWGVFLFSFLTFGRISCGMLVVLNVFNFSVCFQFDGGIHTGFSLLLGFPLLPRLFFTVQLWTHLLSFANKIRTKSAIFWGNASIRGQLYRFTVFFLYSRMFNKLFFKHASCMQLICQIKYLKIFFLSNYIQM